MTLARTKLVASVLSFVALSLGSGCDSGDPQKVPPTFTEVHERVFQSSCVFSTCHKSGPSPAGMLSLERDEAYGELVDVPATVAAKIRIVPGDADASYVMEKLTSPMPTAGDSMPPDAALEAERVALVRAWIDAGAAND